MCSPMPDVSPEDIGAPSACFRYPHCEAHEACGWPQCAEPTYPDLAHLTREQLEAEVTALRLTIIAMRTGGEHSP
jgi:hypothetical protein